MPEGDRGREKAVGVGILAVRPRGQRRVLAVEHALGAHAEVAVQVVHLSQVEVHQPGAVGDIVAAILGVIAVRQTAVVEVVVAFRIHRTFPGLLLVQHDLAIAVERGGEGPRTGHAAVVVHPLPRRHGGVHIAVRGAEVELLLDDRRQPRAILHRPRGLGGVAAHPRALKLVVGRAADQIEAPELVDRREVGEVVVRAVDESELVLHQAGIVVLSLVAALARRGPGAEGKALATVAPARLVVGDHALAHPVAPDVGPVRRVALAVSSLRAPARHASR